MFSKTELQFNKFWFLFLIWSISIILAIFSKFPKLVAFYFKKFCLNFILSYIKLLDIFYIIIFIFIFSIILIFILMLKI